MRMFVRERKVCTLQVRPRLLLMLSVFVFFSPKPSNLCPAVQAWAREMVRNCRWSQLRGVPFQINNRCERGTRRSPGAILVFLTSLSTRQSDPFHEYVCCVATSTSEQRQRRGQRVDRRVTKWDHWTKALACFHERSCSASGGSLTVPQIPQL
jgi:hypothetical protein